MSDSPAAILVDSSGNIVGILNDSGVYRLRTEAKLAGGHGLATETTLANLLAELQQKLEPSDIASLATDASLASILSELQQKLEPNGLVAQGTKGAGSNAWPFVLYDTSGNAVAVVTRDDVKRLAVDISQGQNINVTVGQPVPPELSKYVSASLLNGGSPSLKVDGSVTPVNFDYTADPTVDIQVNEIRVVGSCQDVVFDGASFGGLAALANGVLIQVINEDGTQDVFNVKLNEHWLMFPSPVGVVLNNSGPKDVFSAGFFLGGSVLRAGSSDKVRVIIRDNLTGGGAAEFKFLQARVYGVKV